MYRWEIEEIHRAYFEAQMRASKATQAVVRHTYGWGREYWERVGAPEIWEIANVLRSCRGTSGLTRKEEFVRVLSTHDELEETCLHGVYHDAKIALRICDNLSLMWKALMRRNIKDFKRLDSESLLEENMYSYKKRTIEGFV